MPDDRTAAPAAAARKPRRVAAEADVTSARVLQAGVSVELHAYPGTFHGSSLITDAAISRRAQSDMYAAIARGLGMPPTR